MLLFFLFFSYLFLFVKTKCPNGSIKSYSIPNDCYFFQNNKTDFMNAEGICREFGGHLTSIHSLFENVFLSEKANSIFADSTSSEFWIGANNLFIPGKWTRMDESPFDFTVWNSKEPLNVSDSNCGAVIMQGGKWISDDCYKIKPFICLVKNIQTSSTTTTVAPTSKLPTCESSWKSFNGACYKSFTNSNWQNAEKICHNTYGAHLTSIHSYEENIFVANLVHREITSPCDWHNQTWIGLYTIDKNANWIWTDGTVAGYFRWKANQPDNPGAENCGAIWTGQLCGDQIYGGMNNYICDEIVANFVCKKSPS